MPELTKKEIEQKDFVVVKDRKTQAISKIVAPHSLQIGIEGFKSNGSGLLVKGSGIVEGSLTVVGGIKGALKLPDGTLTLRSGNGVDVSYNQNSTVSLSLADDCILKTLSVAPLGGLIKTVSGGAISLSIDSSTFPDFTGPVKFNQGLSGSLTKLADGSSYLNAGSGVTILTASNGSITISATGGGGGLSFSSELIMNGLIVGEKDGANKSFSLPDLPTDPTSFMLWLNGQLLTQGSDYSISSLNLTFLGSLAPVSTDVIRSMYSRRVI